METAHGGAADFAAGLSSLADRTADPVGGFFGPSSVTWKVNREVAIYLGGMRALLMQLAHPKVAQGVADHSDFRSDPFARLRRTFDTVHAMVFGDRDEAMAAARRLHDVHRGVRGRLDDDVAGLDPEYRADDPELLLWVHATLIDSAMYAYRTFLPALGRRELTRFYEESKVFAALCGLEEAMIPERPGDFRRYVNHMLASPSLTITPTAREVADALFAGPPLLVLLSPSNYVLAAGMLPPRLREGFGLSWALPVRTAYAAGVTLVRRVVPHLPSPLRHVPSARRAARRCAAAGCVAA